MEPTTLYGLALVYENKEIAIAFLTPYERDIAMCAFSFYFSQIPVILPTYGSTLNNNFINRLNSSHVNKAKSARHHLLSKQNETKRKKQVGDQVISLAVKEAIELMVLEKVSKYLTFGKIQEKKEKEPEVEPRA